MNGLSKYVALPPIFILFSSCGHVVHRATIEPGFNASILGGPAYHTYSYKDPGFGYSETRKQASWETHDTQINIGYAWQLSNGKRVLAQAIFLKTEDDENQSESISSIDLYYQAGVGERSNGMGVIVGYDPRIYFMWGRTYRGSGLNWQRGLDFSIGFGIIGAPVMAQLMYTIRYKNLQFSALGEYRYFFLNTDYTFGEDSNPANIIRSRLFMGLVFAVDSYSRP